MILGDPWFGALYLQKQHFLVLAVLSWPHLIWHPLDLVLTSTGNSIVGAIVILLKVVVVLWNCNDSSRDSSVGRMAPPVLSTRDNLTWHPLPSCPEVMQADCLSTLILWYFQLWYCKDTDINGATINPGRRSCKLTKRRIFNWVSVELSFERLSSQVGNLTSQEMLLGKSNFHLKVFHPLPVAGLPIVFSGKKLALCQHVSTASFQSQSYFRTNLIFYLLVSHQASSVAVDISLSQNIFKLV